MTVARLRGTGAGIRLAHSVRTRARMVLSGAAVLALAACTDSNIPFFTAPTSVPANPGGIQNAMTGLFSATRLDINGFTITEAAGYARDGAVFTNTEPRTVTYPLAVAITPTTSGGIWPQDYQNILQAQQIIAAVPGVAPAYTAAQAAALVGVAQTLEAYNYMLIAEAHDTVGLAIRPAGNLTAPPPAVCNTDAWHYIVALLDSANVQFTTSGATIIPITLPVGFQPIKVAGPSGTVGTFASLNRALAAKAELERAYSFPSARLAPIDSTHTVDDPAQPVPAPNMVMVDSAATDLAASAMYDPTQLAPNSPAGFAASPYAIMWDFGPSSGDVTNPIFGQIGTEAQLRDFVAGVDTGIRGPTPPPGNLPGQGPYTTQPDARWAAKFKINPNAVQQQLYNPVANFFCCASATPWSYLYNMSSAPSSTIPLVREETLVNLNAMIHLAKGDFAGANALSNMLRTQVGLLPAKAVASTYLAARDFLLSEQRISLTWEPWAARTISLRMYGLARLADTTWNNPGPPPFYSHSDTLHATGGTQESFKQSAYQDFHTMVNPMPFAELTGRHEQNTGIFVTTCSGNP